MTKPCFASLINVFVSIVNNTPTSIYMDLKRLKLNYEPDTEPDTEGVPHDADKFVVSGN